MSKFTKGQALLVWAIIIAAVVVGFILLLNPQLTLVAALGVLWGKILYFFGWLIGEILNAGITTIVIVALVLLLAFWLWSRRH